MTGRRTRNDGGRGHADQQVGHRVAFVGTQGALVTDYGKHLLSPSADVKDFQPPKQTIPKSKGHYNEWLAACKGDKTVTRCNFDYSGKLIKHNLLGNVAHRVGGALYWDAHEFKAGKNAEANRYLTKTCREGWELGAEPKQS